jgi:hypothetical protein
MPERTGEGDVVGEPPGAEQEGGRRGADPLKECVDVVPGRGIGLQMDAPASAPRLRLGARGERSL